MGVSSMSDIARCLISALLLGVAYSPAKPGLALIQSQPGPAFLQRVAN